MRCACSEEISSNPRFGGFTRKRSKKLKRARPLLVEAMERNGHMGAAPEIRAKLLVMSVSTIDRALGKIRQEGGRQSAGRAHATEHPGTDVRRLEGSGSGPLQADLVAGPSAICSFIPKLA